MFRGLVAFAGTLLTLTGLLVTFASLTVDGWTVLAGVGVALLAVDYVIETWEVES